MISLSDFFTIPPVLVTAWVFEHHKGHRSGGIVTGWTGLRRGDRPSADREISCPPARKSVSAHREVGVSVVSWAAGPAGDAVPGRAVA